MRVRTRMNKRDFVRQGCDRVDWLWEGASYYIFEEGRTGLQDQMDGVHVVYNWTAKLC